jgi:hypothetical protein
MLLVGEAPHQCVQKLCCSSWCSLVRLPTAVTSTFGGQMPCFLTMRAVSLHHCAGIYSFHVHVHLRNAAAIRLHSSALILL